MANATRSGSGLKGLIILVMAVAGLVWWFGDAAEKDGVGIYPPGGNDDDWRHVVLIVNWSHPIDRRIDITFWTNGQPQVGLEGGSTLREWREWFDAPMGTEVRLLAENVERGGRLSCFIWEGPPGNEVLVAEQHRTGLDAGDCDIEHRVGDPPHVEPID